PVGALEVRAHLPLLPLGVVGTEPGLLQALPVHLELFAHPVHAVAQPPEDRGFPRRVGGQSPGAVGAPVVRDVPGEYLLSFGEVARSPGVGVVPAVPEVAGPELARLPAEVLLLPLADLEGPVAKELGVPLGQAELPGHPGAAKRTFALVPAAVHRPVPGER